MEPRPEPLTIDGFDSLSPLTQAALRHPTLSPEDPDGDGAAAAMLLAKPARTQSDSQISQPISSSPTRSRIAPRPDLTVAELRPWLDEAGVTLSESDVADLALALSLIQATLRKADTTKRTLLVRETVANRERLSRRPPASQTTTNSPRLLAIRDTSQRPSRSAVNWTTYLEPQTLGEWMRDLAAHPLDDEEVEAMEEPTDRMDSAVALNLDPTGLPIWWPSSHVEYRAGTKVTPSQRLSWFLTVFAGELSTLVPTLRASAPSARRRLLARSLLRMRSTVSSAEMSMRTPRD